MSAYHSGQQAAPAMQGEQVIAIYDEVRTIVGQMLDAAKADDWDGLVVREHACRQLIEQLMAHDTVSRLDEAQQRQKIALIRQILALDAEIRTLTEPRLTDLQNLLSNCNRKRLLDQTYQPDQE
jgi:flagellar protein FliT